jgi:acyl-coenzyme A synthetase/AMP-(fatty) acid ligase
MEVEEALFRHPAVMEAAVVPMHHPSLGEDICAFVVPHPGIQVGAEELRAHCTKHLTAHKIPREVRFVEGLPHNSMGKVRKNELRKLMNIQTLTMETKGTEAV